MITRRNFLRAFGAGAASLALPRTLWAAAASQQRPNIIFILVDDMGWTDAGFAGSKYYETPNIDKLASQGMVFTAGYANGPNCQPTRACLLSGQYGPRHGVYTVGNSQRGQASQRKLMPVENNVTLPASRVTIAESLKAAGYVTAHMGKWHLGDGETGPAGQGFDVNIAGNRAGLPKSYFSPYRNKDIADGPAGEYITDRLTDEALKFIEKNQARPFFLYLPHYAVHTPLQAKNAMIEKYRNKPPHGGHKNPTYAAMIESTDQGVGRIMSKLDELKIAENTVVVFFSDNGGVQGITSNAPLRGAKGMLYEGGIREPMIVRWPAKVKAGSRCLTPVIGIDFYPTLLEIAGANRPAGYTLDGQSIVPLLTGSDGFEREAIYWHFPCYLEGYCTPLNDPYFRTRPVAAVRSGDWKLLEFFEDARLELYNLKDDIGETRNLAKDNPDKTADLLKLMRDWRKATGAPVPTRLNPKYDPKARPAEEKPARKTGGR
jgi:arylsulfatase A-like enzyme